MGLTRDQLDDVTVMRIIEAYKALIGATKQAKKLIRKDSECRGMAVLLPHKASFKEYNEPKSCLVEGDEAIMYALKMIDLRSYDEDEDKRTVRRLPSVIGVNMYGIAAIKQINTCKQHFDSLWKPLPEKHRRAITKKFSKLKRLNTRHTTRGISTFDVAPETVRLRWRHDAGYPQVNGEQAMAYLRQMANQSAPDGITDTEWSATIEHARAFVRAHPNEILCKKIPRPLKTATSIRLPGKRSEQIETALPIFYQRDNQRVGQPVVLSDRLLNDPDPRAYDVYSHTLEESPIAPHLLLYRYKENKRVHTSNKPNVAEIVVLTARDGVVELNVKIKHHTEHQLRGQSIPLAKSLGQLLLSKQLTDPSQPGRWAYENGEVLIHNATSQYAFLSLIDREKPSISLKTPLNHLKKVLAKVINAL